MTGNSPLDLPRDVVWPRDMVDHLGRHHGAGFGVDPHLGAAGRGIAATSLCQEIIVRPGIGFCLVESGASIRHLDVVVGRGAHGVSHGIAEHGLTRVCLGSVGIEHRRTRANDLAKFFVDVALIAAFWDGQVRRGAWEAGLALGANMPNQPESFLVRKAFFQDVGTKGDHG